MKQPIFSGRYDHPGVWERVIQYITDSDASHIRFVMNDSLHPLGVAVYSDQIELGAILYAACIQAGNDIGAEAVPAPPHQN